MRNSVAFGIAVATFALTACGDAGSRVVRDTADGNAASTLAPTSTTADSVPTGGVESPGPDPTLTEPAGPAAELVGTLDYRVVAEYPHDPTAFTQGLELFEGRLLESTGLVGESGRRVLDPDSGEVLVEVPLGTPLFGEGLTVYDGAAIQLTWKAGLAIEADPLTMEPTGRTFTYDGEGWGLCTLDEGIGSSDARLVMSNGSAQLTFRDGTFDPRDSVTVTRQDGRTVDQLNELECVGSRVLANVWQTNEILVIESSDGAVVGTLDLTEIVPAGLGSGAVLNGIAYREETDTYLVTGKLWPVLYELELFAR